MVAISNISSSNPFHPLWAALSKTKKPELASDGNHYVALVNFADGLLIEINNKREKDIDDYFASGDQLRRLYRSKSWWSRDWTAKLYAGFELLGHRSSLEARAVDLSGLSEEIRENMMFQEAVNLLQEASLIEVENQPDYNRYTKIHSMKQMVWITGKGIEYLDVITQQDSEQDLATVS